MAQAIDAQGLRRTYYLLGQVDKDLQREMMKELGGILKARVNAAKGDMPYGNKRVTRPSKSNPSGRVVRDSSRWRGQGPHMRSTTFLTKAGSKRSGGMYTKHLFGFLAVSATGHSIILDFARQAHSPQGEKLIQTLNQRYGPAPRFLGKQFLTERSRRDVYRTSQRLIDKYLHRANTQIEASATSRVVA